MRQTAAWRLSRRRIAELIVRKAERRSGRLRGGPCGASHTSRELPGVIVLQSLGPSTVKQAFSWISRGKRVLYKEVVGQVPVNTFERLPSAMSRVDMAGLIGIADGLFDVLVDGTSARAWARRQLDSADSDMAFRSAIVVELCQLLDLLYGVEETCRPDSEAILLVCSSWFAERFVRDLKHGRFPDSLVVQIPEPIQKIVGSLRMDSSVSRGLARRLADVAKGIGFLVLRMRSLRSPRIRVPIVLRTYPTDGGIGQTTDERPGGNLRRVDFVVDGLTVPKTDVLIWGEGRLPEQRRRDLRSSGYRFAMASEIPFDIPFGLRTGLPAVLAYVRCQLKLGVRNEWVGSICRTVYQWHLIAKALTEFYRPACLVVYNDIGFYAIVRNIVLGQSGCRTIFYMHSCNWPMGGDGQWMVNQVFPYMRFDVLVSWGKLASEYFHRHPTRISEAWELGCLWSEHARLVSEDAAGAGKYLTDVLGIRLSPGQSTERIVGVMDTSVSTMLSADDLYAFLSDLVDLARVHPEICFLYKPKNPFDERIVGDIDPLVEVFGERGVRLRDDMAALPNFYPLSKFADTAVVVGLSDLVIAACFTNVIAEALGRNGKGIFYDPTDRFPHAFWARIPDMVICRKEALMQRVRYLLYDCSEEEYAAYVREQCGHILAHTDGLAITRLRHRIRDLTAGSA